MKVKNKILLAFAGMCICMGMSIPVLAETIDQSDEPYMIIRDSDTKEIDTFEIDANTDINIQGTEVEAEKNIAPYTVFDESKWGPVVTKEAPTRNRSFPYRAIVKFSVSFPDGSTSGGSGCLISDSTMLTAAHCVYNESRGGLALNAAVYAGFNNNDSYKTSASKKIIVNSVYIKEDKAAYESNPKNKPYTWEANAYDYACITLKSPIGKQNNFGVRKFNINTDGGKNFTLTGYPGEKPLNGMRMYKATSNLYSNYYNPSSKYKDKLIQHKINTMKGSSGAPIYSYDKNTKTYQVIAVNTSQTNNFNIGRIVDQTLLNFINSSISKQ